MKLINQFRSYLLEEKFRINIVNGQINVVNYDSIGHFDSTKVMIHYDNKTLVVKGKNLVVSRLMADEVLVTGQIDLLEFR